MSRLLLSFLLLFALFHSSYSQNKVLIIGVDGCRSDALEQANTPHLDSLRENGICSMTSWQLGKTKSGPGWSSMLTGVWDSKHGVSDNQFSGNNFEKYPFLPSHLKMLDSSKSSALVVDWKSLFQISKENGWDTCIKGKNDMDCHAHIIALLNEAEYDLNMVHYNDVDFAGHTTGFELTNEKYIQAIEEVDRKIGELLKAIKNRPNAENEHWLILSSTDHGGTGKHHAGNSVEERKVWWIASASHLPKMEIVANDPGSYFYKDMLVDSTIVNFYPSIVDIAATAIHHIFPELTNQTFEDWGLDGKSWLTIKPQEFNLVFTEEQNNPNAETSLFYNGFRSVEIKLEK